MSKYSDKFKLEVIKYCIDERNGILPTVRHFNVDAKEAKFKLSKKDQI